MVPIGTPAHIEVRRHRMALSRRGSDQLYIRKKDLPSIELKHRQAFRSKLELAVELFRWAKA
jgi:hypothetical protein